jgi:hypothetical protein
LKDDGGQAVDSHNPSDARYGPTEILDIQGEEIEGANIGEKQEIGCCGLPEISARYARR